MIEREIKIECLTRMLTDTMLQEDSSHTTESVGDILQSVVHSGTNSTLPELEAVVEKHLQEQVRLFFISFKYYLRTKK